MEWAGASLVKYEDSLATWVRDEVGLPLREGVEREGVTHPMTPTLRNSPRTAR